MTAEQDIAALTDGGHNPISKIRTAITSSLVPEWMRYLHQRQSDETAGTYDDFFDDGTLDAGWTTVTTTGAQTITEKRDLLSVKVTTVQTAGNANCLLQTVSPTASSTTYVEAAFHMHQRNGGVVNLGVCMTDGTSSTSNIAMAGWYYGASKDLNAYQSHGTINNYGGGGSSLTFDDSPLSVFYIRLYYTAANTFVGEWSPDGVSWDKWGFNNMSKTMTPTHIGLYWQFTSGNTPTIGTFHYFRDET